MELSTFDQVRRACAAVAARATYVHVDEGHIAPYAASLPLDQILSPELDPVHHYLGHGDDTVAFILTLDAINFGSGYFPHLRKRPGMSGYFTVASSLTDHYRAHGPLSGEALEELTVADCLRIFRQDPANEPIRTLMGHFATALNDLGHYVQDRFDGDFTALVQAAGASAVQLVRLLIEMPYYRDVEPYGDLDVPFYKRAQLTAADLWLAFDGGGPGRFDDIDRLTIFADNLVPHVLRVDGILSYEGDPLTRSSDADVRAQTLAARIEHEQLIPAGSPEEVEIRACALHAVELIAAALRDAGHAVTSRGLDYLLWNRGQAPYYKSRPRHRTRTVFY
jgi:hypothetical protein